MIAVDFKKIEDQIKYVFKKKELLSEALTHKSYCVDRYASRPHNERLEYLGDSVLNFVIAEDLFTQFPKDDEGLLSKKRASLVNQNTLNQLALRCELSDKIILGPGEHKQNSHMKPRVLASCFEAIIGGVYLDSGFEAAKNFILLHFKALNFKLDDESGFETDYKTRLQEITQKFKLGTPTYEVVASKGPSHQPVFLVSLKLQNEERARAEGSSKKKAEQAAAQYYLNILKKENKEIS